jgi:hypothetical protein
VAGVSKLVAAFALALGIAPLTDDSLRPEVDRLVAAVSAARHLTFRGTLPAHALTREEATRTAELAASEGTESVRARTEGEILKRLGLIPAAADYGGEAARAYGDNASPGARYDASTGRLLVPDFIPLEAQRTVMAHEVAHAIADQHFGLRKILEIAPDGTPRLDGDAERARLALVEGDALLTGLELVDPRESFLGAHELGLLAGRLRAAAASEAPSWFSELGQFTHVDGLLFVARVRAHHPFGAVDALWNDPPASSEQILHPEKYDACEAPIAVDEAALPTLAGFGRPTASDVLGELGVWAWLASALPAEVAARAAAGWGGDRAGLYTATPERAPADGGAATSGAPLAWMTVWDDAAEADDFARAARQLLARASRSLTPGGIALPDRSSDDDRTIFSTPEGAFALARRGDAVAMLFAAPEPAGPALDLMLEAVRPRANRRAAPRPRRAAQPGCPRRARAAGLP